MASSDKSISANKSNANANAKLASADEKMSKDISDLERMIRTPSTITISSPKSVPSTQSVPSSAKPAEKTEDRSYILALLKSVVSQPKTGPAQSGGLRSVRSLSSRSNDFTNVFDSDTINDLLDRPKRDPEVTKLYNDILPKIMKYFGVDEEKARDIRSLVKIHWQNEHPEDKYDDHKKIVAIAKLFETKESAQEAYDKVDVEAITAQRDETRKRVEAKRAEYQATKGDRGTNGDKGSKPGKPFKKPKQIITPESSVASETSSEEESVKPVKAKKPSKKESVKSESSVTEFSEASTPKPAKKTKKAAQTGAKAKSRATSSRKLASNGYLMSDEIISSEEDY